MVPNLMIGFGIDDVQAEYVADIKLRNINKEYILKRIEEVAGLEEEIADLQDIVNNPGRIKKLIVAELQAVQKKYAVPGGRRSSTSTRPPPRRTRRTRPRTTRCTCSAPGRATSRRSPPVPAHERGAEVQGGGRPLAPVGGLQPGRAAGLYRPAAVLQSPPERLRRLQGQPAGRLLPTKLGMDPGEGFVWACVTADYSGHLLFFFENGKVARVALSAYQTQTRRKKLTGAYSDKSPGGGLSADRGHGDGCDLHRGAGRWSSTPPLSPPRPPAPPRGQRHDPQAQVQGGRRPPLADTTIVNAARYRARPCPSRACCSGRRTGPRSR